MRRPTNVGADTLQLYRGAEAALACLEDGTFRNCGRSAEELAAAEPQYPLRSAVGPFAFLQYPPAMLMIKAGLSGRHVLRGLALVNLAAFGGLLALLVYAGRRLEPTLWGPALVLVALAGPLVFYATSTLAESLGAFLILLFTVAVLVRAHPAAIGATACLACLTKETAPPFVLAIGLIALLGAGTRPRSLRGPLAGLVAGCALGLATAALFNVFRYGTVTNPDELGAVWGESYGGNILPLSLEQRILNFLALLVSPNGGIAFFWPTAAAVLLGALVIVLRRRGAAAGWWPGAAVLATLLAVVVGLANWYQPFGWFAWGPRLLLPWIPSLVVLLVAAYGERLAGLGSRAASVRVAAAAGVAIAAVALPHVGAVSAPNVADRLFAPDRSCPNPIAPVAEERYPCLNHWAWEKHPILLKALNGLRSASGALLAALFVVAVLALVALQRDRLSQRQPPRA